MPIVYHRLGLSEPDVQRLNRLLDRHSVVQAGIRFQSRGWRPVGTYRTWGRRELEEQAEELADEISTLQAKISRKEPTCQNVKPSTRTK